MLRVSLVNRIPTTGEYRAAGQRLKGQWRHELRRRIGHCNLNHSATLDKPRDHRGDLVGGNATTDTHKYAVPIKSLEQFW